MDDSADTVRIDIHRAPGRAVGDRVHVIFAEDGGPLRLTTEPGGDWLVVAVEPIEERSTFGSVAMRGARITLRRVPTAP